MSDKQPIPWRPPDPYKLCSKLKERDERIRLLENAIRESLEFIRAAHIPEGVQRLEDVLGRKQ